MEWLIFTNSRASSWLSWWSGGCRGVTLKFTGCWFEGGIVSSFRNITFIFVSNMWPESRNRPGKHSNPAPCTALGKVQKCIYFYCIFIRFPAFDKDPSPRLTVMLYELNNVFPLCGKTVGKRYCSQFKLLQKDIFCELTKMSYFIITGQSSQ